MSILSVPGQVHGITEKTELFHWEFEDEHYFLKLHVGDNPRNTTVERENGTWEINMEIPKSDYEYYKVFPGAYRYAFNVSYLSYFMTINDPDIKNLSLALNYISAEQDFDNLTRLNFILTFVQEAMGYYTDINTTGFEDYYKFPLETLVEGGGDCEDTSLLMYTISHILGYNVKLIVMNVSSPAGIMGHVAVGVHFQSIPLSPYSKYLRDGFYNEGKLYYYMETTTNESVGLGYRVRYYVGISPEEAGYVLSDIRFVSYTGYVYSGYTPKKEFVSPATPEFQFPWFLIFIGALIILYIPLMLLAIKREKPLCPSCGNEVEKEYEYCPHCGFWLKYNEPPPLQPPGM